MSLLNSMRAFSCKASNSEYLSKKIRILLLPIYRTYWTFVFFWFIWFWWIFFCWFSNWIKRFLNCISRSFLFRCCSRGPGTPRWPIRIQNSTKILSTPVGSGITGALFPQELLQAGCLEKMFRVKIYNRLQIDHLRWKERNVQIPAVRKKYGYLSAAVATG